MLISANKISKYHNAKCIFEDISFSIEENEKIAIVGVNGTGKSTLLNIIADKEVYDGALMIRKKDLKISYLSQNPDFNDEYTVLMQAYSSINEKVEEFEVKSILNRLGIYEYEQKIKHLSGGQKKRIALAIALLKPCDLLILDEPTNHLDSEMIEWLEKYLIKFNKAVLMVTHDRYFLDRITNTIYEIDRNKLYKYEANYGTYLQLKAQREEIELAKEKKRHAFLRKEIEWVRAGVQARSTKSKERLQRFEDLSKIEDIKEKENVKMISVNSRLGRKTIEWENISKSYGEKVLFHDFSYHLKRHDRIGIIGSNGCGKSTLLSIIANELKPDHGHIEYGDTIRIGYFKQDVKILEEETRVIDFIREISDDLKTNEGSFSAKSMLERFLFDANLQYAKIKQLSGGEKRRLYLLSVLMKAPNVLLLDEPTNDLDIETLSILEDYLDDFNGIIIVVSHDRYFLDRICDLLFVFENNNVYSHIGSYSIYKEDSVKTNNKSSEGALAYAKAKQKQKNSSYFMSSKEKKELEMMESVILDLESKIEAIDEEMNHTSDYGKIASLSSQRESLSLTLDEKNERWMYLLEKEELMKSNKK